MKTIFAGILTPLKQLLELHQNEPARFWRQGLFWSFWLSLAFFPIGYGFREVMPPIAAVCLLFYYKHDWANSTLRRLGWPVWLFACAGLMTCLGIFFSINPWQSLLHAGMGVNKAYILPFIAMECARDLADLRRLCWACVFACFWQGLDGLWQAFTGYDFIMGYPHKGRLTGSLGDYTVGNYLALALVPAFGVFFILRQNLNIWASWFILCALLWPAIFLFIGASSRSGVLAIAGALCLWALLRHGFINWRALVLPAIAVAIFLFFEGYRFLPGTVLNDNRWDLWQLAWRVFAAHPWFGAGAGQYNAAFQALGLAPQHEVITISHPHNLYLDILYAHGIIGFCLGCIFIFGFLFWGLAQIRTRISPLLTNSDLYVTLACWFWLGYAAWLINGIFGHDFYRIWWLALAMCNMGIMIGAAVNLPAKDIN